MLSGRSTPPRKCSSTEAKGPGDGFVRTSRSQVLARGFLAATLATFARSLPVPLIGDIPDSSPGCGRGVSPPNAELPGERADPGAGRREVAGVVDHVVGRPGLFLGIHLRGDDPERLLPRDTVAVHQPLDLRPPVAPHADHRLEHPAAPLLMDERRLDDGDRVAHRGKGGDRLPDPQGDARVGDGFEFRALPRIRKDDRAELFPVDPTVGQQEIASEPPDNVGVGGLSREGDLPRDPVRVHDGNTLLPEEPGHGALPGAYPPCQAENTHAENDTTGGNSYLPSAAISRR